MSEKIHPRSCYLRDGILSISINDDSTCYSLTDIGSDDARFGFRLEKIDEAGHVVDVYDVELFQESGYHACSCMGCTAHGRCKHIAAILALVQAGRLQSASVAK